MGRPERGPLLSEATMIVDWTKFSRMRFELGANFVRILGYFREDGEKSVATIEDAMHRQDAAAIVLPAHTMKAEAPPVRRRAARRSRRADRGRLPARARIAPLPRRSV